MNCAGLRFALNTSTHPLLAVVESLGHIYSNKASISKFLSALAAPSRCQGPLTDARVAALVAFHFVAGSCVP